MFEIYLNILKLFYNKSERVVLYDTPCYDNTNNFSVVGVDGVQANANNDWNAFNANASQSWGVAIIICKLFV